MARLIDTMLADLFRSGVDEERRELAEVPGRYRRNVLQRMRKWQTDLDLLNGQRERLHGRLQADNDWLTQHPEELR